MFVQGVKDVVLGTVGTVTAWPYTSVLPVTVPVALSFVASSSVPRMPCALNVHGDEEEQS
jgi:hypothetical protein